MDSPPPTRPSLLLALRDLQNNEAWEEFVRLYLPLVFHHCLRKGLQEADAADVAQEVLRAVAQEVKDFEYDKTKGMFRGWLHRVTRHKLYKYFARNARLPVTASEEALNRLADDAPTPEDEAGWEAEYQQRLFEWAAERVKGEFQENTWKAFWLTATENLSVKEVAAQLGISVGAVYIARSRVIARLREEAAAASDEDLRL